MNLLMISHIHAAGADAERAEIGIRGVLREGEERGFGAAFGEGPVDS